MRPEGRDTGRRPRPLGKDDHGFGWEDLTLATIEERVVEIVANQMGVDKSQITRETSFVNDLGADSLDTVELVMEFEDEFDISIPDEDAEKIQTVGQAIDYVEAHL